MGGDWSIRRRTGCLLSSIYMWVSQAFSGAFLHSDMNFSGAMLLLAVTLVGSVLQLPGIGGGAQIASIVALTAIFGVEQEPAIAIAVVLWIITFAGCTLVGIPLLIHEGMSVGRIAATGARRSRGGRSPASTSRFPGRTGQPNPAGAIKQKLRGDSAR